MESPFTSAGPYQAQFTVYRTSVYSHAENIALALSIYAEILQTFPGAVAVRSNGGQHEVRVSYGTEVNGKRLMESLVALHDALNKVIPKPIENQPVMPDHAEIVAQLHAPLFS